ncbi:MAG: uroporphyrinogen decarboxylase family protein [Actinomycetota bacterium]
MEPVERVRAALSLERPDRAPFTWWGHTYREEWSPDALAEVTIARQRAFGWDLVKLQPRASCFAEAFGSKYRRSDDGTTSPELVRPAVTDPAGWSLLPAVDAKVPALGDQVEALRRVADAVGPSVPVIQTVFSPLMVAGYLIGEDRPRMAAELRQRPEEVVPALERIADALADLVVRSVDAGAAGVFYAISAFASTDLLTADEYEELVLPTDRRVLDAIPEGAWLNVLHLCGARQRFGVASLLGLRTVSWSIHESGNLSLADGLSMTGRAAMGGIDLVTLAHGTPDEVLEQGRAAIESTTGVGLIVAPGCSVPWDAPEDNLRAIGRSVGA